MNIKTLPNHVGFCIPSFRKILLSWYKNNKEAYLWRTLWQQSKSPYPVWVSEIMLQQTTITTVIPVYKAFMKRFPNLRSLATASEEDLRLHVKGLGYYRRFFYLQKGAKSLCEKSSKDQVSWPKNYEQWLKVAGVGPYTAAALSSITLSQAHIALDGNIERLLCRILDIRLAINATGLKAHLNSIGQRLLDPTEPGEHNQALMELGQKVCRPQQPRCKLCPIENICLSHQRQTTHLAPQAKQRKKVIPLTMQVHIFSKKNLFCLHQRQKDSKFLKGSTGFFMQESSDRVVALSEINTTKAKQIGSFTHRITHHKIHVDIFFDKWSPQRQKSLASEKLSWHKLEELEPTFISSFDTKVFSFLSRHLLSEKPKCSTVSRQLL